MLRQRHFTDIWTALDSRLFNGWLPVSSRIGIFDIRFPEAEKLRDLRATVLAPNHPSLIDAVILLSIVSNTVCIMRADLIESPFLGGAARLAGFVPNDKGPALVRHGIEKIRAGENLLIFPEGTRTEAQAINSFKHGFALMAKKTGAPIQPYLSNAKDVIFPRAWRFYLLGGLRSDFDCILVSSFGRSGETCQQLSGRLERLFREHLENTGEDIRLIRRS